MDGTLRLLLATSWLAASIGCGLNDPKYIDYAEDDGGTDGTTECTAALAAFDTQIQPAVVATCAPGCHATQPIKGKPVSASDSKISRAQLLAYTGATSDALVTKIGSTSHGGGDKSAALPKANIDAWLAEEAKCP